LKKRMISLMLACLLLGLTACSAGEAPAAQPSVTPEAVSTPTPAVESTPEPIEVPEGRLFVTIHAETGVISSEDGEHTILYYDCLTPVVAGVNAAPVNQVLQEKWDTYFNSVLAEMETTARADYDGRILEGMEPVSYSLSRNVTMGRGDETVISFVYDDYSYTGGAHGYNVRTGLTFRSDGSQIGFADLSADEAALRNHCVEQMKLQSQSAEYAQYSFFYGFEQTLPALAEDNTWYLSDKGLVIVANPYDIAPYAFGCIEFTIPYEALKGLVYDWVLPGEETADGTLWGALGADNDPEPTALVDCGTDGQGQPIRFTADGQVRNVRLSTVHYNDYTGGFDELGLLWYATSMQSGEVLRLLTWIPETMPYLKISYQGKDGREQAWFISQSGKDGSLILLDGADFTTLPRNVTDELPFRYDLDNDGAMEVVNVESYVSDEMGGTALRIAITESDGSVLTAETIAYWDHALWLADGDGDGRAEIYFSGDIASDDYVLYGWHYDGSAMKPISFRDEGGSSEWLLGQIVAVDGSRQFTIASTRYLLGTYTATRPFAIGPDGVFAPVEGYGWTFDRNEFWLELRCDLDAIINEETVTLPAGSHILLSATDGESWVEFLAEDYSTGRLSVSRSQNGWLVDGVNEQDAFVTMPYAG